MGIIISCTDVNNIIQVSSIQIHERIITVNIKSVIHDFKIDV